MNLPLNAPPPMLPDPKMKTPCKRPGCAALLDKSGWCAAHISSAPKPRANYDRWRKSDPKQSAIDAIRSTSRWQKVRASKLAANPLCEDPFGRHKDNPATARQVHHVVGLAANSELAFHADNLMSVCHACHARLEQSPSGGGSKV